MIRELSSLSPDRLRNPERLEEVTNFRSLWAMLTEREQSENLPAVVEQIRFDPVRSKIQLNLRAQAVAVVAGIIAKREQAKEPQSRPSRRKRLPADEPAGTGCKKPPVEKHSILLIGMLKSAYFPVISHNPVTQPVAAMSGLFRAFLLAGDAVDRTMLDSRRVRASDRCPTPSLARVGDRDDAASRHALDAELVFVRGGRETVVLGKLIAGLADSIRVATLPCSLAGSIRGLRALESPPFSQPSHARGEGAKSSSSVRVGERGTRHPQDLGMPPLPPVECLPRVVPEARMSGRPGVGCGL